jgi:uncharacterized FAD-dependent dehydrogenase
MSSIETVQIRILPEDKSSQEKVKAALKKALGFVPEFFQLHKESIDARQKVIWIQQVYKHSAESFEITYAEPQLQDVSKATKTVHIIGFGPAGMFAALRAIELGVKPIIIERGKKVKDRRRDLATLIKEHDVNPDSNYCFGEGGAGTYSDGKLYTRSKKRGNVKKVFDWFHYFGADKNITVEAHPHIGTNKLPGIIETIREKILSFGAEIHFSTRLQDFEIKDGKIVRLKCNTQSFEEVQHVILATGHSARDIYELLDKNNIAIEFKPFALGVRIEHPQSFIDACQYKQEERSEFLPPASYSLVTQVGGRGVFSFCMCPGGIVAPCATQNGEVVTNGWSPSKRNNYWANSGFVTEIGAHDVNVKEMGELAGLEFQKKIERKAWEMAGKSQKVPAQRAQDFVNGKLSKDLPSSSYLPGVVSCDLNELFPDFISNALKKALLEFNQKMPGYSLNDALLHAPESRTSSPIRIPRRIENKRHPQISNLLPCGEGAGYAGGIASAAVDGMACVEAIASE